MSQSNGSYEVTETSQGITVRLQKPTTRYLDEFLRLKCAPELADLRLYPNGKELTESFAMYRGIVKMLRPERLAEPIRLIDVGSGKQPRNAALFAFRSQWDCIAVDPRLDPNWISRNGRRVARLTCIPKPIQEAGLARDVPTVVVMVHAHVTVPEVLTSLPGDAPLFLASMRCCVPNKINLTADYSYYDHGCWSPHRRIEAWDFGLRHDRMAASSSQATARGASCEHVLSCPEDRPTADDALILRGAE